jgi:hypothetical protein
MERVRSRGGKGVCRVEGLGRDGIDVDTDAEVISKGRGREGERKVKREERDCEEMDFMSDFLADGMEGCFSNCHFRFPINVDG